MQTYLDVIKPMDLDRKLTLKFGVDQIDAERKGLLDSIADYILLKLSSYNIAYLNFICTHNSRRSQIAQVLMQAFADEMQLNILCYSGGTEVTAFNPRAVRALQRIGISIFKKSDSDNPSYFIDRGKFFHLMTAFSKVYDYPTNPRKHFAAVMTCSEADADCPIIPGAEVRFQLPYTDPKHSDDSLAEASTYDATVREVGTEMLYIIQQVKKAL